MLFKPKNMPDQLSNKFYLNSKMGSKIHKNQVQLGNIGHFKENIEQARINFNGNSRSMVPQNI